MSEVVRSPLEGPWSKGGKDVPEHEGYFRDAQEEAGSQAPAAASALSPGAATADQKTEKSFPGRKSAQDTDQITNNIPAEDLDDEQLDDNIVPEDSASVVTAQKDNLPDGASKLDGASKVDGASKLDGAGKEEVLENGVVGSDEAQTQLGDDDLASKVPEEPELDEVEPEPIAEDEIDVESKLGGAKSELGADSKLSEAKSETGDKLEETDSKAGDALGTGSVTGAVTGALGAVGDTATGAVSAVGSKAEEATGDDKGLGSTVGDTAEKALDTAEETTDKALDTAEDTTSKAGEAVEGAEEKVGDTAEEAIEEVEKVDLSMLKGGKINKGGNVISDGKLVGRVVEGALTHLVGKTVGEDGKIWNDRGEVIGRAEPIPADEVENMTKDHGPFEAFPDAVVNGQGMVVTGEGEEIGKVVEGDIKKLRGMSVDADGDIQDRVGNVVGKAERWEPEPEPEPEPEVEVDRSILAGKRVNKAANVVDGAGVIFGRVVEGDPKRMIGRMCDKQGWILSESGDRIGRAEVVPEGEREGLKEGPFAELSGCTVTKDGTVVTPGGDVVGRLISGDGKVLFGRPVDEDGDVCDRNGNCIGKAERWEPPVIEKKKNPLAGRRVNREGSVVSEDGDLVGKLTSGQLSICSGKEIDDDGDVVDGKGNVIGHVSLLEDIPPEPVEEESAEDKEKRETAEKDKELAKRMSACLSQVLDKVKPICDMITRKIEKADRTPKEELDEEELVKEVRPLIEEGGRIMQEAHGIIKGLDPDGRIQANAKHKTATRDASPEEYQLADILKELTGTVTKCIDDAKKRLEGMPHAKKELNPLWGLLSEPLFQILAAVGLLLNGVLGLVGRLLSGLGLGGLVDSLLGGLGVKQILASLGIGGLTDALTGGDKKKKKSGGLLGLGG